MSTNDTVLLLASGKAGGIRSPGIELDTTQAAVKEVCIELARMIPDDGEGASHLITIDVVGCASCRDARQIAQNDRQQCAGQNGCGRSGSELGTHRLGRRVCPGTV